MPELMDRINTHSAQQNENNKDNSLTFIALL